MASKLTLARRAVWDAIDNWQPLASTFRQKYRYEKSPTPGSPLEPPNKATEPTVYADLPAIAIIPSLVQPRPETLQTNRYPYTLRVMVWTHDWTLEQPEQIWQDVRNAVFNSANADTGLNYIKAATGSYATGFNPVRWQMARIGEDNKTKCVYQEWAVTLRITDTITQSEA
jgi:hypothetical protein